MASPSPFLTASPARPPSLPHRMSFLRALADSLSSLLFSPPAAQPVDAAPSQAAVVGEHMAVKLQGYFDLAKEEIDRAVHAAPSSWPAGARVVLLPVSDETAKGDSNAALFKGSAMTRRGAVVVLSYMSCSGVPYYHDVCC